MGFKFTWFSKLESMLTKLCLTYLGVVKFIIWVDFLSLKFFLFLKRNTFLFVYIICFKIAYIPLIRLCLLIAFFTHCKTLAILILLKYFFIIYILLKLFNFFLVSLDSFVKTIWFNICFFFWLHTPTILFF